jgi:hypothetical protein
VDEFWSETVCADAAGAPKAAGLEQSLASVVVRASPQAGPVLARRPRYTQQMIQEPATHAFALFLREYADARQVNQSRNHVPYAILCSPGKGQTHRGQFGVRPLGYRQVGPREPRPGPQSSRMFGGLLRAVGRDPHLDSRVDLDKCRPSIARHSSLSIGIGSAGIRLAARRLPGVRRTTVQRDLWRRSYRVGVASWWRDTGRRRLGLYLGLVEPTEQERRSSRDRLRECLALAIIMVVVALLVRFTR